MNTRIVQGKWQQIIRISGVRLMEIGTVLLLGMGIVGRAKLGRLAFSSQVGTVFTSTHLLLGLGLLGLGIGVGLLLSKRSILAVLNERQQLEKQLQASETRLNDILNGAIASIVSFRMFADYVWDYDYWSAGCTEVFGFTPQELMNDKELWWSRIPEEDRELIIAPSWANLYVGKTVRREYRFYHKDGSLRWINSVLAPRRDEAANCWIVTAVETDITHQKHVEQALRSSQENLQKIASSIPHILYLFDLQQGKSIYLNQQSMIILGYSSEEICCADPSWLIEQFHPDDRHLGNNLLERFAGLTDTDVLSTEYRFRHKNGAWRWLNTREVVFNRDEHGAPSHVLGVIQDITDRKQIESRLQQQVEREHFLRQITQQIHQSLDLNEILNTTVHEVRQALHADRTLIFRLYPDYSGQVIKESALPEYPALDQMYWLDECFPQDCYEHYRRGKPRIVLDVTADDWGSCLAEFMESMGVKSKIVAPITQRTDSSTQVWGLLIVHACAEQRQWQPSQADFLQQIADQLAIAIYQADLYRQSQNEIGERQRAQLATVQAMEREQQLREQERLIRSIAHNIRQFLDLGYILSTTAEEVRRFLQVDRVVVYRFNSNWHGKIIAESVVDDTLSIFGMESYDPCFAETTLPAYRQGRIHAVSDIQSAALDPCYVQFLSTLKIRAVLAIPILVNQDLWGLLIAHHTTPHQWQQVGWHLLRQLGTQLAIGIHQSQLYEQLQQLNSNLENLVQERTAQLQRSLDFEALLQRITDKVRDSLDEAQILQTAVRELALGLGTYSCDTGLYDLEQDVSYITYEYVSDATFANEKVVSMSNYPGIYDVLRQGCCLQFCWYPLIPYVVRDPSQHRSILACPLIDDQGVIGDLWLYKFEPSCFTEAEVRLVQQVANQCAIAVRQSRLYQAAQAQVEELERLNHLKDDFLSTVSHELRTPMSNIKMATQMLDIQLARMGVFSSPENDTERYFKILREECYREIRLIDDLLDLTRLDSNVESCLFTSIQLQVLIPYIVEPFLERAASQQQQLMVQIPDDLPAIITDTAYLERVLSELLNNACKYTPAGESILVSASMRQVEPEFADLAARDSPDSTPGCQQMVHQIQVTNTGVEISEAEHDRIFDKFYRIPNNDPWKHSGTGLGLALVKKLVMQLGGTIQVESADHQTCFTLQFRHSN